MSKVYPIAVIGGGAAGVMAVIRTVLNNDETLFFPGSPKDKKRSRGFWVRKVENMPGHLGYQRGIENPNNENIEWLSKSAFADKFHWKKNKGITELKKNQVGLFELTDNKGEHYLAENVILCTGVMDVQPHIAGTIEPILPYANVQVADYCIRCDGHHALNTDLTVIGSIEDTIWVAFILYERYRPKSVTVLTNGEELVLSEKEEKIKDLYGIKIYNQKIVDIKGNAKEAKLESYILEDQTEVITNFTFVSMGMIVYNELAKGLGAEVDERGFVVTDEKGHTSVENLYVAGDLRANTKKQIYTSWDTAVDSADVINSKMRRAAREKLLEN